MLGPSVRGRKRNLLLDKLTIPCHLKSDRTHKRIRCSTPGCRKSYAVPRQASRVLKHVLDSCPNLPADLRDLAIHASSSTALGAQAAVTQPLHSVLPTAKGSRGKNQPSVHAIVSKEGWKQINTRFSHNVLRLICAAGLPPTIVDYPEWHTIFHDIDPQIECMSSTTFVDTYIPKEASLVRKLSIDYLRSKTNLTISFDGGTTRRGQSFYTIHVFERDDGAAHLLEASAESGVSHTGEHIADKLQAVWTILLLVISLSLTPLA